MIIVETGLYLGFLCLDIAGFFFASSYLKYGSIIFLCLFISLSSLKRKKPILIPLALLGSVMADYFLLFTMNFIWGIGIFLLVQGVLFLNICREGHQNVMKGLMGRIAGAMILFLGVMFLPINLDAIAILAGIYIVCFAGNVIDGLIVWGRQKNTKNLIFMAGIILFFLCDLHVGLYNLSDYVNGENTMLQIVHAWAGFAMWLFYLPGQILIGQSNLI